MNQIKNVTFKNTSGEELTGRLELPANRKPHNFVIFAHCFTCSKNLNAVVNITRELARAGYAVLRFDFTGLGDSEGDFSNTNFSGNVEDLIEAARFLEKNYEAPSLLIGHSLGGAAVIFAAAQLPYVKAVATIGTPGNPAHVEGLLKDSAEEIERRGKATVMLEGRPFTIKKQFLDDLKNKPLPDVVQNLGRPIAIFHSPQDTIVNIGNAEEIYISARHPKSFISLDGADHLLTRREDAQYVGRMIGVWASRYLPVSEEKPVQSNRKAAASLYNSDGYTTKLKLGHHYYTGDEPVEVGGNDYGPNPYDLLTGALAACKAMTAIMYARRKKLDLQNIVVHINHSKDYVKDCENCEEDKSAKIDTFDCKVDIKGDLTEEQRNRILEIADRCPVHRTLMSDVQIKSVMGDR